MGKRGQKVCGACTQVNGARAYTCKKCGEPFVMKNGRIRYGKKPIQDWTTLKEGDCFRVLSRSGDYFIKQATGDKVHFATTGKYRVKEITYKDGKPHGLACWGLGGRTSGYYWFYMGEEEEPYGSGSFCTRQKHKLARIKDPFEK